MFSFRENISTEVKFRKSTNISDRVITESLLEERLVFVKMFSAEVKFRKSVNISGGRQTGECECQVVK